MKNTKEILKLSDKYIENIINLQTPIMEGRRVTAKFEERYQVIIPIGQVNTIAYYTPRNRDEHRGTQKEKTFEGILQNQMRELALEENQTFQAYC